MPKLNGFDVLAWLRARANLKLVPIVVLSSSRFDSDISKARQLGAADYRVKPSAFDQLVDLVRDLSRRWLASGTDRIAETPGV